MTICDLLGHRYLFLRQAPYDSDTHFHMPHSRTDVFYCQRCLEYKERLFIQDADYRLEEKSAVRAALRR